MQFRLVFLILLSQVLYGCFGSDSSDSDNSVNIESRLTRALTYWDHTKDVLDRYCVVCHRSGGDAPFALSDYQQVFAYRSAIRFVLDQGSMPPLGYNRLPASDIDMINAWIDAGALEGDSTKASKQISTTEYTYNSDIKPIIDAKCANCHLEGGFAPFPLENYAQVYSIRSAIFHQVTNNTMPPWPPSNGFTPFKENRSLSSDQRYKVLNWLEGGAPEGESTVTSSTSNTGTNADTIRVDMTIQMKQAYTPVILPDEYRCFVLDWDQSEAVYVTAINVIPGAIQEVHHVIVGVIEPENVTQYERKESQEQGFGYECFGGLSIKGVTGNPRQLAAWAPGNTASVLPENTGILVQPGSKIIMQMHYNTITTAPKPDQTSLAIRVEQTVDRPAFSFLLAWPQWLRPNGMPIPANDPDVTISASFPATALQNYMGKNIGTTAEDPFSIHAVGLHMHTLGTWAKTTLIREDKTEQTLLEILNWDFSWQDAYAFEQEMIVNPNDKLTLTCNWDNSDANQLIVNGEQLKSRDVEWGEGTWDEMCLTILYVTRPPNPLPAQVHTPSLYIASPQYRDTYKPGGTVPIKLNLSNFTLSEPSDSQDHTSADSDHSALTTGHYHIYLDQSDDDAEHVIFWEDEYFYTLPETLAEGEHTLRISLRASDHHPLGIEESVQILVKADDSSSAPVALINNDNWTLNTTETTTLAAHAPDTVTCPSNSYYNEDGALEVQTGYCNYLALQQPILSAINAWDELHLVLWHGPLQADAPADSHIAIAINGKVIWEKTISIPAEAKIYDETIPVPFDVAANSTVEYHLHNHGYNTWSLLTLDKLAK